MVNNISVKDFQRSVVLVLSLFLIQVECQTYIFTPLYGTNASATQIGYITSGSVSQVYASNTNSGFNLNYPSTLAGGVASNTTAWSGERIQTVNVFTSSDDAGNHYIYYIQFIFFSGSFATLQSTFYNTLSSLGKISTYLTVTPVGYEFVGFTYQSGGANGTSINSLVGVYKPVACAAPSTLAIASVSPNSNGSMVFVSGAAQTYSLTLYDSTFYGLCQTTSITVSPTPSLSSLISLSGQNNMAPTIVFSNGSQNVSDAQTYTVVVTASYTSAPTVSVSKTIMFTYNFTCDSIAIVATTQSTFVMSALHTSTLSIQDFNSTSGSFNHFKYPSYCGLYNYTLTTAGLPSSVTIPTASTIASPPTLQVKSTAMSDLGSYTATLTATMSNSSVQGVAAVTTTFQIVILNPCVFAVLSAPAQEIIQNSVLNATTTTALVFKDDVSVTYGNGTLLCGGLIYSISSVKTSAPTSLSSSDLSIDSSGVVSLSSQSNSQIGNSTATVTVYLNSFPNITFSLVFNVMITPCQVTSLVLSQSPANMVYYMLQPDLTTTFSLSSIVLTPACVGYSYSADGFQPISNFTFTNSIDSSAIYFKIASTTNRLIANNYPVNFSLSILNYISYSTPPYYPAFQTFFIISMLDPCLETVIITPKVTPMQAFPGYPTLSNSEYYVNDTVTLQSTIDNYCGSYNFKVYTGTKATNITTGDNGQKFQFYPLANTTIFGPQKITVVVISIEMSNITQNFSFIATTLEYIPSSISDITYQTGQQPITNYFEDFQVTNSVVNTSQGYLDIVLIQSTHDLAIPIQSQNVQASPFWCLLSHQLLTTNYQLQVKNSDNTTFGSFKLAIVRTYTAIGNAIVAVPFSVTILPQYSPAVYATALADQYVYCAKNGSANWYYTLPSTLDYDSGISVVSQQVILDNTYLNYDQSRNAITQKKYVGETVVTTVKFVLLNSAGIPGYSLIKVYFVCPSFIEPKQQVIDSFSGSQINGLAPSTTKVWISRIGVDGTVEISFNTTMTPALNISTIQNQTIQVNGTAYPALMVKIIPGLRQNSSHIGLNWSYLSFSPTMFKIRLLFDNPETISSKAPDQLMITFYDNLLFKDYQGYYLRQGTYLVKNLPRQSSVGFQQTAAAVGASAQNLVGGLIITNVIVAVVIAGPVQQILSIIKQLIITTHIMLVNVSSPPALSKFFSSLMTIITLQLINTDNFIDSNLQLDQVNPFNDQFGEVGYSSLYIIKNFGLQCFIMVGTPLVLLFSYAVLHLHSFKGKYSEIKIKVRNFLFFNGTISFFNENYIFLAVCASLNTLYLRWDTYGNVVNSLICVFFCSTSVVFLLVVVIVFNQKRIYNYIDSNEKQVLERFWDMLSNLNFKREGQKVLIFTAFSVFRKLLLAVTLVYLNQYSVFSVMIINFQSLAMIICIGYVRPFANLQDNSMELLNEFFVLLTVYHLFCFTDFVPDLLTQDNIGISLIIVTVLNIGINLGVVTWGSMKTLSRRLKLAFYKWRNRRAVRKNALEQKIKKANAETQKIANEASRLLRIQNLQASYFKMFLATVPEAKAPLQPHVVTKMQQEQITRKPAPKQKIVSVFQRPGKTKQTDQRTQLVAVKSKQFKNSKQQHTRQVSFEQLVQNVTPQLGSKIKQSMQNFQIRQKPKILQKEHQISDSPRALESFQNQYVDHNHNNGVSESEAQRIHDLNTKKPSLLPKRPFAVPRLPVKKVIEPERAMDSFPSYDYLNGVSKQEAQRIYDLNVRK